jgi:hypothetical protein
MTMILLLADALPAAMPSAGTWDVVAQQVPALLLFVATMFIVFRYLDRKEERYQAGIKDLVATWTTAQAARDAAFLLSMKEGSERARDERLATMAAAKELAGECHARQSESIEAMRELARVGERFSSATDTLCDVTSRLERLIERK